jgi:hypothetical protein
LDVRKGIVRVREVLTNSYPLYVAGVQYRNIGQNEIGFWELITQWEISQTANVEFFHAINSNNIVSLSYVDQVYGKTLQKQFDFEIKGKTLIIRVFAVNPDPSHDGNYAGFWFTRSENTPNAKHIQLTYSETAPIVMAGPQGDRFFYSTYFDWARSGSNGPPGESFYSSSGTSHSANYNPYYIPGELDPQTNSRVYTPLNETLYVTVSRNLEDTVMKINSNPSLWRDDLNSRPVLDVWRLTHPSGPFPYILNNSMFDRTKTFVELLEIYGLKDYLFLFHWWAAGGTSPGFNANPPTDCFSEYPRSYPVIENPWEGGFNQFKLLINSVKRTNSLIAFHQDVGDMFQGSPQWNQSFLSLDPRGKTMRTWINPDCVGFDRLGLGLQPYSIATDKMGAYARQEAFLMKRDYNPTALFLDVTTKLWSGVFGNGLEYEPGVRFIDYSYKNSNSRTFAQAIQNIKNMNNLMRNEINGPLFGEGAGGSSYDRMIAGYTDGVEAEISFEKKNTPVFPEFELRSVKPLMANHGMGYLNRYEVGPFLVPEQPEATINIGQNPVTVIFNGNPVTIPPFDFDRYNADTFIYGHTGFVTDHFLFGDPLWTDITMGRISPNDPRARAYILNFEKYFVKTYYQYKFVQNLYLSGNITKILYRTPQDELVPLGIALDKNLDFMNAQIYEEYSNGLKLYVNRHQTQIWAVNVNGQIYYLPPNGWLAINLNINFIMYSSLVDNLNGQHSPSGRRVDCVKTPEYIMVDGRDLGGFATKFPADCRDFLNREIITDRFLVLKPDNWYLTQFHGSDNDPLRGTFYTGDRPVIDSINTQIISNTQLNVVNISGNFFFPTSVVVFDGATIYSLALYNNQKSISMAILPGFRPGFYKISILTHSNNLESNPYIFVVQGPGVPPTLRSVEPSFVVNNKESVVTLNGAGFTTPLFVVLDDLLDSPKVGVLLINQTQINLTIFDNTPKGSYSLKIVTLTGTSSSKTILVLQEPKILSQKPLSNSLLPPTTIQVLIGVTTDVLSTCKYSTISNQTYDEMQTNLSLTPSIVHESLITNIQSARNYTYYIKCRTADNPSVDNSQDYVLQFEVLGDVPQGTGSNSGSSSSGSGSGSGTGGPPRVTLPQCNDGIDNDFDGLIDYPADPGCTSVSDNLETDIGRLINSSEPNEDETHLTKKNELKNIIFWFFIILFVGAIVFMVVMIIRLLREHKNFSKLSENIYSKSNFDINR